MQMIEIPAGSVLIQKEDFDTVTGTVNLLLNLIRQIREAFPQSEDSTLRTPEQCEVLGVADDLLKRAEKPVVMNG